MDDEFKLCWKNFQDNIASGFQNLYDRGDLVDVTLACDGKLLHAHKIVLAICSPYFQEIFTTNPCKHPIIILKDVSFNIMLELLEFMYQGVVNVKHTELQSFMKIGQLLQIKGLATNSSPGSSASDKSASQTQAEESPNSNSNNSNTPQAHSNHNSSVNSNNNSKSEADHNDTKGQSHSRTTSPGGASRASNEGSHPYSSGKRPLPSDFGSDALSIYSGKQLRRSLKDHGSSGNEGGGGGENSDNGAALENSLNSEEFFLPPIPHISMVEPRYDLGGLKRESENTHHGPSSGGAGSSGSVGSLTSSASSSTGMRNPFGPPFNMENYNFYKSSNSGGASGSSSSATGPGSSINNNGAAGLGSGTEYPNELYMPNDYSKNFANHMDIPQIAPGEHWFEGKLEFMLSQRGKPLLVHDGHTFGIQYVRKDKKYWQCNLSRKFNCKARVTTTDTGDIIVTNNEHCHTEIRQHLRKDYQRNKVMMNALINLSTKNMGVFQRNHAGLGGLPSMVIPEALAQGSPIHEMVQNLHDLAKATAEQQQQQQREQLQRAHEMEEPLDCNRRSSAALEEMARTFIANNSKPTIAFPGSEVHVDPKEEPSWKEKVEGETH
ncbi:broad-complex core protein isoforms 1/2/3/4/5 isoform X2 [Drosophila bipectinata]|uniref:broad-complex core protein isoforms 1/2/3/4/5 isoform X2 n=1 Tax=Drosophila bipectinata TaxID=42026 RepID=UPI001C895093|nr:broad-complex core protein isoforms 1/2/3/4/5 isoform X2 [Drosophila bipectinata]